MKKKLIAIAVAGAMAAPMAAVAELKISGQLQTQVVQQSGNAGPNKGLYMTDGGHATGMNGGSWGSLAFNASEDLGGGMKALAHYSFNISTDATGTHGGLTGDNRTRSAYVGLSGDFGTVLAGRMNHPYKTSTIGWDPMLGTFMQARFSGGMAGHGGASNILYGTERDNTLAYANNFNGIRVVAGVILDEGADRTGDGNKTTGNHAYAFSVNAPVGPVEIAVAHANLSKYGNDEAPAPAPAQGLANKSTATKVGVRYSVGDFTLAGQIEMLGQGMSTGLTLDANNFPVANSRKGNVMFLTGSYKMGANTISASLGRTDKRLVGNALDYVNNQDLGQKHQDYAAIQFSHAFSQKTNVFVGYRTTRNVIDTVSGSQATLDLVQRHASSNAFGAGLRVRF